MHIRKTSWEYLSFEKTLKGFQINHMLNHNYYKVEAWPKSLPPHTSITQSPTSSPNKNTINSSRPTANSNSSRNRVTSSTSSKPTSWTKNQPSNSLRRISTDNLENWRISLTPSTACSHPTISRVITCSAMMMLLTIGSTPSLTTWKTTPVPNWSSMIILQPRSKRRSVSERIYWWSSRFRISPIMKWHIRLWMEGRLSLDGSTSKDKAPRGRPRR